MDSSKTIDLHETTVGFDLCMSAVGKAGRVLYAFTEFYLYFYELPPTFIFKHFPVFGPIAAAVYCVDESVEQDRAVSHAVGIDALQELLSQRMQVNESVLALLREAREYCAFERRARADRQTYTLAEVLRATQIRSVDFRLMHHALLQITGSRCDLDIFDWFRSFEMLMEIEDDLASIEEDERKGGYNYYCFVHRVVGSDAVELVESVRTGLERRLLDDGEALFQRGMQRCGGVIERYRRIVPRRRIAG